MVTVVIVGVLIFLNSSQGPEWVSESITNKSEERERERGPKPSGNTSSHFLYQEIYYDCSKPIRGEWTEAGIGPMSSPGWYFVPSSQNDLDKYCRQGAVIEYRAVIDILKRKDVETVIAKYDTTKAWVKALGHTYIHDKDYLKRILPAYSDIKIDCIIVVHSPEGNRFFIEDGEEHVDHQHHHYREVPADVFLASLNNAPDVDVTNFWLGLH